LQRVQNDAARLILGLDRRAHITSALKKTTLIAHSISNSIKIAVFMNQCFHRHCPQYIIRLVSIIP